MDAQGYRIIGGIVIFMGIAGLVLNIASLFVVLFTSQSVIHVVGQCVGAAAVVVLGVGLVLRPQREHLSKRLNIIAGVLALAALVLSGSLLLARLQG